MKLEDAFFIYHKDRTKEERLEIVQKLIEHFHYENSVDTLYDVDGTDALSKDLKVLNRNDLLLTLTASLAVSSHDIHAKFLSIFKDGFDKAPFYTQELAVKIAYASIIEPELFALISKENRQKNSQLTEYISYVLGGAGVGKTAVVFKLLVLMLQKNNKNLSI